MPDHERSPDEWREILRNGLQYPEETRQGSRRERRQARRAHRDESRRQTKDWIRTERQREPIRPAAAAIIVALILALGAGARWLWPGINGTGYPAAPAAVPSPFSQDSAPATARPTAAASASATPTIDCSDPNKVAQQAVQLYLTRDPMKDRDHRASVERAAPYLEAALVDNLLGHADPGFDKLNSQSAAAVVTAVTTGPADPGLPPDNPLRVWRRATATLDVKGYNETTQTTTLQLEVTSNGAGRWRVSRILGL